MKVTAYARRVGPYWVVDVPEVDGAYTQAKRLDMVAVMAADAVALLEDLDPRDVDVDVVPVVDDEHSAAIARVRRLGAVAQQAEDEYAAASRGLVDQLRTSGLTVRDTAVLLGLSAARISQLQASRHERVHGSAGRHVAAEASAPANAGGTVRGETIGRPDTKTKPRRPSARH